MSTPILYVFAISHYCEKARWALDYLRVNYILEHLPPGAHRRVAKKLGLRASSLPILRLSDRVIQGSADIITWAENNKKDDNLSLNPGPGNEINLEFDLDGMEIEKRLDDVLGVHVRRYYYSEALVEYPHKVRPLFLKDLSPWQQKVTTLTWGIIRGLMIKGMDLGHLQGLESREIVEGELDWLDQLLSDGRPYLNGGQFTRTDITAASLLAPLVKPVEHPTYSMIEWSPNIATDCETWQKRRCMRWTKEIYHRLR